MLSYKRYGWLCVLGAEVAYFACVLGGYLPLRTVRAEMLHQTLLETLPGFAWGSALGILAGALDTAVVAWIFGLYYVWMHNTSIVRSSNVTESTEHLRSASPKLAR
jgi:hypothetical protein